MTVTSLKTTLPRFRCGRFSGETIDGRGAGGRYLQIDWFSLTFTIELGVVQ